MRLLAVGPESTVLSALRTSFDATVETSIGTAVESTNESTNASPLVDSLVSGSHSPPTVAQTMPLKPA